MGEPRTEGVYSRISFCVHGGRVNYQTSDLILCEKPCTVWRPRIDASCNERNIGAVRRDKHRLSSWGA